VSRELGEFRDSRRVTEERGIVKQYFEKICKQPPRDAACQIEQVRDDDSIVIVCHAEDANCTEGQDKEPSQPPSRDTQPPSLCHDSDTASNMASETVGLKLLVKYCTAKLTEALHQLPIKP
jgi:hypothetical protein